MCLKPLGRNPLGFFIEAEVKENDSQRLKDAEEIWRYRLSMDKQLTELPVSRLPAFYAKFRHWFQREHSKQAER